MSYRIVNRHNLHTLNLAIKAEIHAADFIAIDTEFTGLGDPKLLKHQNMETRYTASVELVKTHALVALGVSIFKGSEVTNYLFLLLSAVPHCINPQSITFLSQHGFDFNDQYENGIPYIPGNDFVAKRDDAKSIPKLMNPTNSLMRELIQLILCKTIVVHNGFLDLMFIYHSLYAKLPKSFPTFIADLDDICTQGIYDTKYISDYCVREPASFLELLYKKACRSNRDKTIEIKKLGTYTKEFTKIGLVELGLREQNFRRLESKSFYCEPYAVWIFNNRITGTVNLEPNAPNPMTWI